MITMPIATNLQPQLPKKTNRSELTEQSAELRAAEVKVWKDTLYRSAEFRQALFGNPHANRFDYEGAAYIMGDGGKLVSANTLWDEPDRYHEVVMSNRLFVRDQNGAMRQIQVTRNDANSLELGLSQPLDNMDAFREPPAPSFWKQYIFRIFFLSEMREYDRQKALYDAMQTNEAKESFRVAVRFGRGGGEQEQDKKASGRDLEKQRTELEQTFKNLEQEIQQLEMNRGAKDQQPAEPQPQHQPVPAPAEQPIRQEQPKQPEQKAEAKPEVADQNQEEQIKEQDLTRGLKPYSKKAIENVVKRMTYPLNALDKVIPPTCPVKLDGVDIGVLVAMATANPELSLRKSKNSEERVFNNPDVTYKEVVGTHFIQNMLLSRGGGAFKIAAERSVGAALRATATNDLTKLAKIIAFGLTQNNKVLQEQRQLTDVYTAYAELGHKVLKIMDSNEQLKNAVMEQLGNDSKQIDMAKAAKNISDFRVELMEKTYPNMVRQYGQLVEHRTWQGDKQFIKTDLAILGNSNEVAKVCVLSDIEVSMNRGEFKLEGSKFTDPNAIGQSIADIENTRAVGNLLISKDRGQLLQDPVRMMQVKAAAEKEIVQQKEFAQQMKEMGFDMEKQEEKSLDISFG